MFTARASWTGRRQAKPTEICVSAPAANWDIHKKRDRTRGARTDVANMNSVAFGMGEGWEVNIARLIDQANDTLQKSSSSASSRRGGCRRKSSTTSVSATLDFSTRKDRTEPAACGRSHSSPYREVGRNSPNVARPTFLWGDRSASYRPDGTTARWETHYRPKVLDRSESGRSVSSERPRSPSGATTLPVPPPPPLLSRFAESRVHDARIDGMEDRIKLEVHTLVRRDLEQQVSVAHRATDDLQQRVEGLASEVSDLGKKVRKFNTTTHVHEDALEEIQAAIKRNRNGLTQLEGWHADREGWCARHDATLSSLAEDSRTTARRCRSHQEALGSLSERVTQADLTTAVTAALKAAEAATVTALAPVREHFSEEIGAIRRRQLAAERRLAEQPEVALATSHISRAQVKAVAEEAADEAASEMGKQLWRRVESHVQAKLSAREDGAEGSGFISKGVKRRLAEVEDRANGYDDVLVRLQTGMEIMQGLEALPDTILALQQRLEDGLARMDRECERRSNETQRGAHQNSKVVSEGLTVMLDRAIQGLNDRLKRLEEPQRFGVPKPIRGGQSHPPETRDPASLTNTFEREELERVAKIVEGLVSGAAAATVQHVAYEERLEELSEKLCGHTLKLQCLEGLWRDADSRAERFENISGEQGAQKTTALYETIGSSRRQSDVHPAGQKLSQEVQQPGAFPLPGQDHQASALPMSTNPRSSNIIGLSGFLKRFGSSSTSSSYLSNSDRHTEAAKVGNTTTIVEQKHASTTGNIVFIGEREQVESPIEQAGVLRERTESNDQARFTSERPIQPFSDVRRIENIDAGKATGIPESAHDLHKPADEGVETADGRTLAVVGRGRDQAIKEAREGGSQAASSSREGMVEESINGVFGLKFADDIGVLAADDDVDGALEGPRVNSETKRAGCGDGGGKNVDKLGHAEAGDELVQDSDAQVNKALRASVERSATPGWHALPSLSINERKAGKLDGLYASSLNKNVTEAQGQTGAEGENISGKGVKQCGGDMDDTKSECESLLAESMHSRWSLPDGGGLGGLREQRVVWGGFGHDPDEDGSVGQSLHSKNEDESAMSLSARSRVGSYDLEDQTGDGRMGSISPGGPASPTAPTTPGATPTASATVATKKAETAETQHSSENTQDARQSASEWRLNPARKNDEDEDIASSNIPAASSEAHSCAEPTMTAADTVPDPGTKSSANTSPFPDPAAGEQALDDTGSNHGSEDEEDDLESVLSFVAAEREKLAEARRKSSATGGSEAASRSSNTSSVVGGPWEHSEGSEQKSDARKSREELGGLGRTSAMSPPARDDSGGTWAVPDFGFSSDEEEDDIGIPLVGKEPTSPLDMTLSDSPSDESSPRKAEVDR